jgi:hypothetical protein
MLSSPSNSSRRDFSHIGALRGVGSGISPSTYSPSSMLKQKIATTMSGVRARASALREKLDDLEREEQRVINVRFVQDEAKKLAQAKERAREQTFRNFKSTKRIKPSLKRELAESPRSTYRLPISPSSSSSTRSVTSASPRSVYRLPSSSGSPKSSMARQIPPAVTYHPSERKVPLSRGLDKYRVGDVSDEEEDESEPEHEHEPESDPRLDAEAAYRSALLAWEAKNHKPMSPMSQEDKLWNWSVMTPTPPVYQYPDGYVKPESGSRISHQGTTSRFGPKSRVASAPISWPSDVSREKEEDSRRSSNPSRRSSSPLAAYSLFYDIHH